MVLEVAIFKIKPGQSPQFEAVFPKAAKIIASVQGHISHELQRCIETKDKYFFLVKWENIDAHLVNFRQSPKAPEFRGLLFDFFVEPPVVEHFELMLETK